MVGCPVLLIVYWLVMFRFKTRLYNYFVKHLDKNVLQNIVNYL